MPVRPPDRNARVSARTDGEVLEVSLAGTWKITDARPGWAALRGAQTPSRVRLRIEEVDAWDSSLLLFLFEVRQWCAAMGAECDLTALPERLRTLLAQLSASHASSVPRDRGRNLFAEVGDASLDVWRKGRDILEFVGECVLGIARAVQRPHKFRWRDCFHEMQQCGAMALPIVSLISLLVGLTLAYQAAVQLRQFGADIYVADLVGLSVVREMGPMMAAIILAGRTGAAFAATLGNMKANEEIDALETLGIPAVEFLVLPRLIALGVMMPLLALYANLLGVVGGMMVAAGVLQIPPTAYWVEMQTSVGVMDIGTGLIKALTFGLLIGFAGCLRGLQAERSAAGVGRAATSAVVTGILLIIVFDAIYAVLFNAMGI
jgi:phospholipid/cholesterol/gamma-HCH transport system permease protein